MASCVELLGIALVVVSRQSVGSTRVCSASLLSSSTSDDVVHQSNQTQRRVAPDIARQISDVEYDGVKQPKQEERQVAPDIVDKIYDVEGNPITTDAVFHAFVRLYVEHEGEQSYFQIENNEMIRIKRNGKEQQGLPLYKMFAANKDSGKAASSEMGNPLQSGAYAISEGMSMKSFWQHLQQKLHDIGQSFDSTWNPGDFNCQHLNREILRVVAKYEPKLVDCLYLRVLQQPATDFIRSATWREIGHLGAAAFAAWSEYERAMVRLLKICIDPDYLPDYLPGSEDDTFSSQEEVNAVEELPCRDDELITGIEVFWQPIAHANYMIYETDRHDNHTKRLAEMRLLKSRPC